MNSSPDTPILINSDGEEDDSDVEFIHEEKNEDLDVIFVSQSTALVTPKCEEQHTGSDHVASPSAPSRSMSISSTLDMTLTIEDRDLNSPLDLSSKKGPSDFSDISEASDDSGDDSDDDDSGMEDLDDDSDVIHSLVSASKDVDVGGDIGCGVTGAGNTDSLMPLQDSSLTSSGIPSTLDSSDVPMVVVTLPDASLPSASQDCVISIPSQHVSDTDMKTNIIPLYKSDKMEPFLNIGSKTKDGLIPKALPVLIRPKELQSTSKSVIKEEEVSSADMWDSLKKDLDFLNNTSPCPTAHGSLSYPGSSGPGMLSISKILDPTLPPSKCVNTSASSSNNFSISSILNSSASCDSGLSACHHGKATSSHLLSAPKSGGLPSTSTLDDFSIGAFNKQLPPKKQQRCMRQFSCPNSRIGNLSSIAAPKSPTTNFTWEKCSYCQVSLLGLKSSRCLQGHVTCGTCLEEKVKLVLTGKTKESLRCVQSGCDSYYPMSELKQSLPNIVVEILEDKLDNDYIDYIANMILKNAGGSSPPSTSSSSSLTTFSSSSSSSSTPTPSVSSTAVSMVTNGDAIGASISQSDKGSEPEVMEMTGSEKAEPPSVKKEQITEDWPLNWIPMDKRSSYSMVPLEPESQEYVDVALKFHNSMKFPAADIIKIFRVQNPILWKYYTVKRTEMIIENDGLDVHENNLFHGTTNSVLDAICKKGFDWRVCGKNATVYGQGSYFAVNAAYSHMYTDNANESRRRGRVVALFPGMRPMPAHIPYLSPSPSSSILSQQIGFGPSAIQVYPPPAPISSISTGSSNTPPVNVITPSSHVSSSHTGSHSLLSRHSTNDKGSGNSSSQVAHQQAPHQLPPHQQVPHQQHQQAPHQQAPLQQPPTSSSQAGAPGPVRSRHITHQLSTIRRQLNVLRSSVQQLRNIPPPPIGQPTLGNPADIQASNKTVHRMFLAKVLVGKYTGGHSGLRKPPPLYPCTDPYGKCYDSCVDNIHNPKIFVIFDTAQAYPSYVLEYHCEDGPQ